MEEWLKGDNVPRRAVLTAAEFRSDFEVPGTPVVLTRCAAVSGAVARWTAEYLAAKLQGHKAIAGARLRTCLTIIWVDSMRWPVQDVDRSQCRCEHWSNSAHHCVPARLHLAAV